MSLGKALSRIRTGTVLFAAVGTLAVSGPVQAGFLTIEQKLIHGGIALGAGAASLGLHTLSGVNEARWREPILIDGPVRSFLESDSESGKLVSARGSDVLVGSLVAAPALMAAAGPEIGSDLVIAAESILVTSFVSNLTKRIAGRRRPNGVENDSFFSGHTATAFAGAGLVCSGVIGDPDSAPSWLCPGVIGAASVTGLLRIGAGKHYFSDVLVGAGVGWLVGYGYTRLMHSPAARSSLADESGDPRMTADMNSSDSKSGGTPLSLPGGSSSRLPGSGVSFAPVFAAGGVGALVRIRW